jgi:hypothetical protein
MGRASPLLVLGFFGRCGLPGFFLGKISFRSLHSVGTWDWVAAVHMLMYPISNEGHGQRTRRTWTPNNCVQIVQAGAAVLQAQVATSWPRSGNVQAVQTSALHSS